MSNDPELDAMQRVLAALTELDQDAQSRVLRWASDKLGVQAILKRGGSGELDGDEGREGSEPGISEGTHPRVASWMRQNSISDADLDQVFFRSGDQVEIVAAEISGKTTKDRVLNIYLLAGIAQFIVSGTPTFGDAFARELCRAAGCLDTTNHTKIIADKGNAFGGSKERGWSLTQPGMKQAATLIKTMTAGE